MLGFSKPLSKWLCSLARFAGCRMPFSKNSWPSLLLSNIFLEALRKQKATQGDLNRSLLRDLYLETSHIQSVEYVEFSFVCVCVCFVFSWEKADEGNRCRLGREEAVPWPCSISPCWVTEWHFKQFSLNPVWKTLMLIILLAVVEERLGEKKSRHQIHR